MQRRSFLTLLTAGAVTAVAGCSTGPADEESSAAAPTPAAGSESPSSSAAGAFPVTIKHALGTTTITKQAKRVVAIGYSDADIIAVLGVVPVGVLSVDFGGVNGSTPTFDAQIKKLGGKAPAKLKITDSAPIDEINRLRPDIIIGTNSSIKAEDYAKLSKVAPVIAYPTAPFITPWRDSLDTIGKALGLQAKAATVRRDTDALIAKAVTKFPQVKGKSVAWARFAPADTSIVQVLTPLDPRQTLLAEFGMTSPGSIAKAPGSAGQFFITISAEKAQTIDAQVLIFNIEAPNQEKTVTSHALLGQIPALKSGAYFAFPPGPSVWAANNPSPLTMPTILAELLPKVAAAASKAK